MQTNPADTSLPPTVLADLGQVLASRLGLHFPEPRWGDLERGIAAAASALGARNIESCVRMLLSRPWSQREIDILATHLTIGESYFFRDPLVFDLLRQHVLPPLLRARAGSGRYIRLWSAGCSTGEEAYSLAMLLDEMIPEPDTWSITLLASDINPARLRIAAEAEYGAWSFRGTPEWLRARYFDRLSNGRYRLQERIRNRVTLMPLNLVDDVFPTISSNSNAMDIILCRNVLMYFTPDQVRSVAGRLYRSLVEGGWLIVSAAEASSVWFAQFTPVNFNGLTCYRRIGERAASHGSVSPIPSLKSNIAQSKSPTKEEPEAPRAMPVDKVPVVPAPGPAAEVDPILAARECANRGQLGEAEAWCRQAITCDKLNPSHHYLLAVVLQELGCADEAAQALQRALYLDGDFIIAHYALGNLRRAQGRFNEARRHFDNALRFLYDQADDAVLPESDGLSASRLAEIIEGLEATIPLSSTA